jgi:translation initiation factor 2-alpha kinase 4
MRHPNLLSLYAVKFHISSDVGQGSSRLVLLCEQAPPINLADVLDDVDGIREEKVIDYMKQILGALQALHAVDIPHRGLALECIGLASRSSSITPSASHPHGNGSSHDSGSTTKLVKLARAGWLVRILSLHRSNAISAGLPPTTTGPGTDDGVPEGWLTRECLESPLAYTKARDVHDAGMVMMQLLLGRDVYRRFQEPRSALSFCKSLAWIPSTRH